MAPPILPPAGMYNPWSVGAIAPAGFTNPFVPDASGRTGFQRAGEILKGTLTGSAADVKTVGGLLPGETGAVGDTTRQGLGYGFDMKSVVVYGIALLLIVFGLKGVFK